MKLAYHFPIFLKSSWRINHALEVTKPFNWMTIFFLAVGRNIPIGWPWCVVFQRHEWDYVRGKICELLNGFSPKKRTVLWLRPWKKVTNLQLWVVCGAENEEFHFVSGVALRSCEAVQLFTQWNTLIFQWVTLKSPLNSTISSYINIGKEHVKNNPP